MLRAKKLGFEALEPRQLLAANPIITEFMASNDGTLIDGNGAASDWIEIYNEGDQSVDLAGYALTDDPADANKWLFPSVALGAGDFLVVYASGNDALDVAGNLHTNFSLSASGEYLGFVDPNGNVLSEFGPSGTEYPPQTSDVSYGLAFDSATTNAVSPNSAARYLIPTNNSVDSTWTDNNFDDSLWQTGSASLGYENFPSDYAGLIQTDLPIGTTSAYVRIPFTVTDTAAYLTTLQMKYDDGFIAYINGFRVASDNAPATGAYDSLATSDHPDYLAVNYVDFDVSAYSNLLHVGTNTLAIQMLNDHGGSSDLLAAPNMPIGGGSLIDPALVGQLISPTPGALNTNVRASDVEFSRVGGTFVGSFQLTMTAGPGDSIRYTTDGTIPQANSPLYAGPITVSSSLQFRARAFGSSGQLGSVTSAAYTLTTAATDAFTSDLPIVVLENFGQGTPGRNDFEYASLSLYETDPGTGRSSLSDPADLSTRIGQHVRGSSTAGNPKTNLRIEIRDENDEDKSVELLGMPAESDWVLYAPYNFDRAMLRNTLYYDLSRQMGNYAARTRFVEVYSNTNDGVLDDADYMGVYVLMENIKRDSNRVDIAKLTPEQNSVPEITGGYILKLDRDDGTPDSSWYTDRGIPTLQDSKLVHVEPDRADMTIEQRDYIRGYVQDFEDALYGPNSTDPELGYQAYFDVDAAIDHHLVRVLSKEPDGLRLSTYLVKDRDGKLAYGPVWDFDRSSGADNDGRSANPEGWYLPDVDFFESDWWGPLFDDPNFMQRWVDRWQELRQTVLSDANIQATIDGQASQIAEAAVRNFDRWTNITPNGGPYAAPGLTGWEAEVSQLSGWLLARVHWMDEQMIAAPSLSPLAGNVSSGTPITLTSNYPGGDVYYTLDGSDPRADGGGLSPNAILYTGPIVANQTTQVSARAFGTPSQSYSSYSDYPSNENPANVLDGDPDTKYLNFGEENSGIIITPNFGSSTVRSFTLTTANDAWERDPASWELYGTNDPIQSNDNSTGLGENWTLIDSGDLSLPFSRKTTGDVETVSNSTAYTSYKLMFPTVKNAGSANSMQVADIRFYESTSGSGSQILAPGDSVKAVQLATGGAFEGLSPWSQLVTGLYSVEVPADDSSLRITELHYHPADPTSAELALVPGVDADDFEFVELLNTSNQTISLNGVHFTAGIDFDFTSGAIPSLAPGETVLVVRNQAAFEARYGSGLPVAGESAGKLSNGGEQLTLLDDAGQAIFDFTYDDASPWAEAADGDGPSLEAVDPLGNPGDFANWRASANAGGSPGVYEAAPALPGDFDQDEDVDGFDFLAWQTGFGGQYGAGELSDWQANYGQSSGSVILAAVQRETAAEHNQPLAQQIALLPLSVQQPTQQPTTKQRANRIDAAFEKWEQEVVVQRARNHRDSDRLAESSPTDAKRALQEALESSRRSTEEIFGRRFGAEVWDEAFADSAL